jgi:hypothetical protein
VESRRAFLLRSVATSVVNARLWLPSDPAEGPKRQLFKNIHVYGQDTSLTVIDCVVERLLDLI